MRNLDQWLSEYNTSHVNPINKRIHWVCVPAILFSLLGLASLIHVAACLAAIAALSAFYARLNMRLALLMLALMAAMFALITLLPGGITGLAIYGGVFALAWVGQFYGHHIEGAKPSFFTDLLFLAIGPLWCGHAFAKRLGLLN
jgi:uncharacterized membrane protein YGL010W